MRRSVSIAFWTYVTPLVTTRSMRIGLALFGLFTAGLLGIFASGSLSESFMARTLQGARHFLIMLGLPVAAAVLSEMALRDGINHRTLLYPLLGPVPRTTLALVRTAVAGIVLGLGASVLLVLIRVLLQDGFQFLAREILALMLGAVAYMAMFGVLHLFNKRGLIVGLVILFFFDLPLGKVPFGIRNLSPSYHMGVIANQQEQMVLPVPLELPETSVLFSTALLAGLALIFSVAAAEVFRRKNLGELC
jgi:hypothetical protein